MVITPDTRIQLTSAQSSSVLGNETIVLNYEIGNYYELNEIGGFIWSLLQTNNVLSVAEINARLLDEFEVDESVCQQELVQFLETLFHEKLIRTAA